MVDAVRYDENLIFFRMIYIVAILNADDCLYVEIIEDVMFIASQTLVFHIEYRLQIEWSDIASTFHSHREDILIVDGLWRFLMTNIFRNSQ